MNIVPFALKEKWKDEPKHIFLMYEKLFETP